MKIIWTALPNGVIEKQAGGGNPTDDTPPQVRRYLLLSVLASPRLETADGTDTHIRAFPEFHDWPATVSQLGFDIRFDTGAHFTQAPLIAADSNVWRSLFPLDTPVKPFVFNGRENTTVHSSSASGIESVVKEKYSFVAAATPTEFPVTPGVALLLSKAALRTGGLASETFPKEVEELKEKLRSSREVSRPFGWEKGGAIATDDNTTETEHLLLSSDFHQVAHGMLDKDQPHPPTDPPADPADPDLEFHQLLSVVGQYPKLMRLLGLVIDFELDITNAENPPFSDDTEVWLEVTWPNEEPQPRTSRTRCEVGENHFRAKAFTAGTIGNGYLFLNSDDYRPVTLDVDGAAAKIIDLAELSAAVELSDAPDAAEKLALPALRSGGLALTRTNNGVKFVQSLDRQATLNQIIEQGDPPLFYAEDLTRGLRIDVLEPLSQKWHSLMQRTGEYVVGATTTSPQSIAVSDEGYISTAATTDFHNTPGHLYLPEALCVWDGWSLVVPRPGKVIGITDAVEEKDEATARDLDVQARFKATPATLPTLRFGREYKLRARLVDLAGNSVPFDDQPEGEFGESRPVTYGRFEPIASPPVLLRDPRREAESVERLVLYNDNRNILVSPPPEPATRHIAPPKVSITMAEQHAVFDRTGHLGRRGPAPNFYGVMSDLDRGGFYKSPEDAVGGPDLVDHPDAESDPNDYDGTFFYPVDQVAVNYVPDPLAMGAAFRFLPGPDATPVDSSVLMSFDPLPDDSPLRKRPFRLVLHPGNGSPDVDEGARLLHVYLPAAETATARVSCYPGRERFEELGLWQWISSEPNHDQLVAEISQGRHWMFTPYRELTLVHAVRVPLEAPDPSSLLLTGEDGPRRKGDTFARFNGYLGFHRKSTVRVDMRGSWREAIDQGPGTDPPTTKRLDEIAFSIHGDRGDLDGIVRDQLLYVNDRHEFGDTKHRLVRYTAEATTRFAEYFVERKECTFVTDSPPFVLSEDGIVGGWTSVRSPDGQTVLAEGADYTLELGGTVGENGAVKPGMITFRSDLRGTFDVAFLARPVQVTSAPRTESIKSTARPAPPKVHSIVPTFAWSNPPDINPNVRRSHRQGRGLRIFLERPWYSSGLGERLGVLVFNQDPSGATYPDLATVGRWKPFTSMWGSDPAFRSPALPHKFPTKQTILTADGTSNVYPVFDSPTPVDDARFVAAHNVQFDEDRDLYYVDVEFDAGLAYMPFVRLALVRFQPESLDGCHLSSVVVADFVQLAPDRFLSVSPGSTADRRMVRLAGPSYTMRSKRLVKLSPAGPSAATAADAVVAEFGEAEVIVETRDAAAAPGDVSWVPVGSPPTKLTPMQSLQGVTWSGEVKIPRVPARLVVLQYELHSTEPGADSGRTCDAATPKGAQAAPEGRRVIYSDIIEL